MKHRVFRPALKLVSLMLATAISTQAGPIGFGDVVSLVNNGQNTALQQDLRIRNVSPGSRQLSSGSTGSYDSANVDEPAGLLTTVEVAPQQGGKDIQTIEQGEISGTICDCGEIAAGGGFPFFALLPLAGIPFIFIRHKCPDCDTCPECLTGSPTPSPSECPDCSVTPHCVNCESTPTPTPSITPFCVNCSPTPTPEIPEPGTLLLFGSGLAALGTGVRRRFSRKKLEKEISKTEE